MSVDMVFGGNNRVLTMLSFIMIIEVTTVKWMFHKYHNYQFNKQINILFCLKYNFSSTLYIFFAIFRCYPFFYFFRFFFVLFIFCLDLKIENYSENNEMFDNILLCFFVLFWDFHSDFRLIVRAIIHLVPWKNVRTFIYNFSKMFWRVECYIYDTWGNKLT